MNKHRATRRITKSQLRHWGANFDLNVTIGDRKIDLNFLSPEKKFQVLTLLQFVINEKD